MISHAYLMHLHRVVHASGSGYLNFVTHTIPYCSKPVRKSVRLNIFFHRDEARDRPLVFSAAPNGMSSIAEKEFGGKIVILKGIAEW